MVAKKVHIWVFAQVWSANLPVIPKHLWVWSGLSVTHSVPVLMTQACSQATWYRINVRVKSSHCCLGAVTEICGLQGLWVMFRKKKQQAKTLSLTAWFACNWVAKRLHAAICTVEEVDSIVSTSVNECLCARGLLTEYPRPVGEWHYSFSCTKNNKERNVDGEMEECSVVCQSQTAAGRHRQDVLTGNQLL